MEGCRHAQDPVRLRCRCLAVWLVPGPLDDDGGSVPPISVLLGTAMIVGLATTLALYLTAAFAVSFTSLAARPDQVLIGYKG
jgi:hypothetical protein